MRMQHHKINFFTKLGIDYSTTLIISFENLLKTIDSELPNAFSDNKTFQRSAYREPLQN